MTTTVTEVDGRPAEIRQEPELAALTLDQQIDNVVHDIRRTINERNRRAVAHARSGERLKESKDLLIKLMDQLATLDEKRGQEQLAFAASEGAFDDPDEDEEEGADGEEDDED